MDVGIWNQDLLFLIRLPISIHSTEFQTFNQKTSYLIVLKDFKVVVAIFYQAAHIQPFKNFFRNLSIIYLDCSFFFFLICIV
jgi:hypothetical protein